MKQQTNTIAARPSDHGACTCVWPAYYHRQQQRIDSEQVVQSRTEIVTDPISTLGKLSTAISSVIPGSFDTDSPTPAPYSVDSPLDNRQDSPSTMHHDFVSHENQEDRSFRPKQEIDSSIANRRFGGQQSVSRKDELARIERKKAGSMDSKRMGTMVKNDVITRSIKKQFARSSENKTRSLISYREDLVVTLKSLVPFYRGDDVEHVSEAMMDSRLCRSCHATLAHYLYYSPARFEPYIGEASTRAYLTLIDDAVASLSVDEQMEAIGHRELERVLRGELAVAEMRIAVKMAKFHKKSDFLNLFPIRVGEFAELKVSTAPPSHPEGFLKKTGKKAMQTLGISSSKKPSPQTAAATTSGPV